jgi:RING finger/CHY zinc finger protein 1
MILLIFFLSILCCNKVYSCRLCHDEECNDYNITPITEQHNIDRKKISRIICNNCNEEQDVSQYCIKCNICFGLYFCNICNLFDDIDKQQYHCNKCNVCRIGGKENTFHCDNCNTCLDISSKDNHKCYNMKDFNCPICMEDLFESTIEVTTLLCGHYIHRSCLIEWMNKNYKCPICSKSIIDLTKYNNMMDIQIQHTPMPEEYKNKTVDILCNECNKSSNSKFHILGNKCNHCDSYNTRLI